MKEKWIGSGVRLEDGLRKSLRGSEFYSRDDARVLRTLAGCWKNGSKDL